MPTSSSPSARTGHMFGVPFTMTFWMPVSIQSSSSTPSQTSTPNESTPSSQSQASSSQPIMHPLQAMIQAAIMTQLQQMQMGTITTPSQAQTQDHDQSQAQTHDQQQAQVFSTQIPLPALLNMFFSMSQGQGQPIDLATFMQGGGNKPQPPTSTQIINNLPKYQYHAETSTSSTSTSCSICQCDYEHDDEYTTLKCQHSYHSTCIIPWLKQHHTCPMCRYPIETDDAEFNRQHVYQQQQTWKHVASSTPPSSIPAASSSTICTMSHHHHQSCTLLSGNTSTLTLSCGHSYHIECLDTAQRILHSSSTHVQTIPQIVICPHCQTQQSFPVPLGDLLRVTTPTTTPVPIPVSTAIIPTPAPATALAPKDMDEHEHDMPDWIHTNTAAAPAPSTTAPMPTSIPTPISSRNGSATIEEDTEMTDA